MKSFSPNTDNKFKATEDLHIAHGPTVFVSTDQVKSMSAEKFSSNGWTAAGYQS